MIDYDALLENKENLDRDDLLKLVKYLEACNELYIKETEKSYRILNKALSCAHQPFPRFWELVEQVRDWFKCDRVDALTIMLACSDYPEGTLDMVEGQIWQMGQKANFKVQKVLELVE